MKWTRCVLAAVGLCLSAALPVRAEEVIEAWRSPFGTPYSVSVNPTNGSVWAATGSSVMHVAADGSVLGQWNGFWNPQSVAANSVDGSCWIADTYNNQVVHMSADGTELWRGSGFSRPRSISVNPADGSCWVADAGNNQVVHLSGSGAELWRGGLGTPVCVSVNSADGSCWVGYYGPSHALAHLSAAGVELWRSGSDVGYSPTFVSVNPTDDSCWVAETENSRVVHLSASGAELWRGGFGNPVAVSVNPADGSCWVVEGESFGYRYVWHLSATGAELFRDSSGFWDPISVSVDPADGSCWVADRGYRQLVHLAETGTQQWQSGGFRTPNSVSVNLTDSSCWVADTGNDQVVHLSAGGAELWRGGGFNGPLCVSVNSADGSCWVADGSEVVHLSAGGAELWRGTGFSDVNSVSVNSTDGSCWATGGSAWSPGFGYVAHLSAAGVELWRGGGLYSPSSVSVDPSDGSCWVADTGNSQVVHLVVTSAGGPIAYFVASPVDGRLPLQVAFSDRSAGGPTSWLWDFGDGAASNQQAPVHVYQAPGSFTVGLSVSNENGSDVETRVGYINVSGFPDVLADHWAYAQIYACVDANVVKGYDDGLYHPEYEVTRDQMAVYIARALVSPSGDAAIPDPEPPPSFSDVLSTHWAYKHIEYAVSQNVVKGYDDGTYQPGVTVDRGQMAVYVARAMVAPGGDAAVPDPVPPATFPDVPDTFWAYKQVEYCVNEGVVKGYDDGNYHPDYPVTRDQMAVYVARAFGLL